MRNILAVLRHSHKRACIEGIKKIFGSANKQQAMKRFHDWKSIWQVYAEKAVSCLEKDLPELLTFFDFPEHDWVKIRSTNYLERAFREIRRRTHSISSFPDAKSAERIMVAFAPAFLIKATL